MLSHFLNVELREFHEQPVQTTKIEPKHIPDREFTRTRLQKRKKSHRMPSKSYPLGLQFLNKSTPKRMPRIQDILIDKPKLPIVKIRKNTKSVAKSTTKTTTTTAKGTTRTTSTPSPTTASTKAAITTTVTPTTTTPSFVVTYPKEMTETTTTSVTRASGMTFNDPLSSISVDSLFSDLDLALETQSFINHGSVHMNGHSHDAGVSSGGAMDKHQNMHDSNSMHHDHHRISQSAKGAGHEILHSHRTETMHGHNINGSNMGHSHGHLKHENIQSDHIRKQDINSKGNVPHVNTNSDTHSSPLDKLFVGMFNHHIAEDHGLKHLKKQEEVIPLDKDLSIFANTPSPAVPKSVEGTTVHAKPITKRGINKVGYVSGKPKVYIDNYLNVQIWQTTPPPQLNPRTMRYHATTSPSMETQINRQKMSEYLTSKMRTNDSHLLPSTGSARSAEASLPNPTVAPRSSQTASSNPPPNVSQNDLVHLRGIHIMFSDGKQDTSGKIPTVHLTASISETKGKNLSSLSKTGITTPPIPSTVKSTVGPNDQSVVDKIVGTAVIRNGHLYLILYPFGDKKSLKLNFNGTKVSQVPLPHNRPISYTDAPVKVATTTKAMEPMSTTQVTESLPHLSHVASDTIASEYQAPGSGVSPVGKHQASTHVQAEQTSHVHNHMHHHMMSATAERTTLNHTTIRNLLSPLNRFMSPWRSLNLSKVFPFPRNHSASKQNGDDDSDLDVVTFIAQATDPFERIKSIMESIANTSLFRNSSGTSDKDGSVNETQQAQAEAKFNFELKIQTSTIHQVRDYKQTTQQNNDNNSEEMLYDTSTGSNTAKSKQSDLQKLIKTEHHSNFNYPANPPPVALLNEYIKGVSTAGSAMDTVTSEFNLNTMEAMKIISTTQTQDKERSTTTESSLIEKVQNSENHEPAIPNTEVHVTESTSYEEKDKPAPVATTSQLTTRPPLTTTTELSISKALMAPDTTLADIIGYQVFNNSTSTNKKATKSPMYKYSDKFSVYNKPGSRIVPGKLSTGSNIQPVANAGERLTRGQAEQVMSLSDILNDIRRIQLHNMHKFNIQNNNFNNLIVNEASRQNKLRTPMVVEGPLFQETSTRRFSGRPSGQRTVTPTSLQSQMLEQRQNAINDALDAMLVLSVDDILADHTTLHGAIVMSQRQKDQSSSNR